MNTKVLLLSIAKRLMGCAAVPYHEEATAAEVLAICTERGLAAEHDPFGNILVRVQRGSKNRPFVLAAHLDHPGFVIRRALGKGKWEAEFLGGVGDTYFVSGVPLLVYPGRINGQLGQRRSKTKRFFEISAPGATNTEFAVWDLPEFKHKDDRITGRACDDLIGAAAILSTLVQLSRGSAPVNVMGVFSRAEEVGFHGALALANTELLPKDSLVISLETSRELRAVKMGQGVIVRVGDRVSTFDSNATRFLVEVANDMGKKHDGFRFQRALMGGGTCEATAYQEYGFQCAAVCVALGNYHNCGVKNKIRPELVSLYDAVTMVDLLTAAARQMMRFDSLVQRLPNRLEKYANAACRNLTKLPLKVKCAP